MRLEWILVLVAAAVVWAAKAEENVTKTLRMENLMFRSAEIRGAGREGAFCNLLRSRLERIAGMEADTAPAKVKKADKEFKLNADNSAQGIHEGSVDANTGKYKISTVNPHKLMGLHMVRVIEGTLGKAESTDTRMVYNESNQLVCEIVITHLTASEISTSCLH